MTATTLIVGCCKASSEDSNALQDNSSIYKVWCMERFCIEIYAQHPCCGSILPGEWQVSMHPVAGKIGIDQREALANKRSGLCIEAYLLKEAKLMKTSADGYFLIASGVLHNQ